MPQTVTHRRSCNKFYLYRNVPFPSYTSQTVHLRSSYGDLYSTRKLWYSSEVTQSAVRNRHSNRGVTRLVRAGFVSQSLVHCVCPCSSSKAVSGPGSGLSPSSRADGRRPKHSTIPYTRAALPHCHAPCTWPFALTCYPSIWTETLVPKIVRLFVLPPIGAASEST